jgi:uncharacterized membrane protein
MTPGLKLYAVALSAALLCDALWLGVIARQFYRRHLGYIMTERVVWGAAFVFYLLHAAGVVYFCVMPAIRAHSTPKLILSCIAFGLITYGTYDLTNWATVRGWPAVVSVVDMAWGALISLIVGLSAYGLATRLTM